MKLIYKLSIGLLLLPLAMVQGQNAVTKTVGDSLSLSEVMTSVINNYPALKKAEKEIESANAKIDLTKTAYLPDVNFATSFTLIGPAPTITFNGNKVPLSPPDIYSAAFSVNQNVYDFGRTNKNVAFDEQSREMTKLSVTQLKQRLSMALVGNFYSITFLQEAVNIKNEQLRTLNEHLNFVEKKANTGSATKYEILTTKVRISAIENQKTDILTALKIQNGQLNSFLGKPQDNRLLLKNELFTEKLIPSVDSLCNTAFANRNEIKMALQKDAILQSRLNVIKVQNNPSLNAFASGGYKNGYLNSEFQDVGKLNFAIGVGLKVPIFDANRSKHIKIQANADIEGNHQETELARRNITNEVVESKANAESTLKKVAQSELQLSQAQQAYALAETSFQAGVITNLDLLDSFTAVAESKLVLLKTKIDYSVNLLKLKIALGEQIY
ncbi:MAG: TolC family protein [Paludibacter sp.]